DEFLYDGLVAAAKRCESCLHKQLGIEFSTKDETPAEEPSFDSMPKRDEIFDESTLGTPPEIELETEGTDDEAQVPLEMEPEVITSDDSIRIESMGATEDMYDAEIVQGSPRDFSDDFELVEPDSLVVTPDHDGIETPEIEDEDSIDETEDIVIEESEDDDFDADPTSDSEEDITVERPKYVWESGTDEESEEESDAPPPAPELPSDVDHVEDTKVWSPMDEPSPEDILDDEEIDTNEETSEPPPPPPPPESEESEEERRRRARRLFFGA
ncbi:MAG: hypothetical protein ACFFF4_08695, partial [Candidatus Thorarchaeota archaeon]